MPLQPKDITEERLMALCIAIDRVLTIQSYILDRMAPSEEEAHKKHIRHGEMRVHVSKASQLLQVHFLGD